MDKDVIVLHTYKIFIFDVVKTSHEKWRSHTQDATVDIYYHIAHIRCSLCAHV